jgi:hypothetical protein
MTIPVKIAIEAVLLAITATGLYYGLKMEHGEIELKIREVAWDLALEKERSYIVSRQLEKHLDKE